MLKQVNNKIAVFNFINFESYFTVMKKTILAILLLITSGYIAQNRRINFETGNLASVLAKAKKENKLVFIDGYTTWCGPCKHLAKYIFTNDTVADYFNATFVNYQLDMEKGEGISFAEKHNIRCFPSLLFINGDGNLVHRTVGDMPASSLIAAAKTCFDKEKTYSFLRTKYEKEALNESNVTAYIDLLMNCCQDPSEKALAYIKTVKEEDLIKRANWIVVRDFVYDKDSREVKYFLNNLTAFENKFGKDTVEQKLEQLGKSYFSKYSRAEKFDKAGYENAKAEFLKLNWKNAEKIIFEVDMETYHRFDKSKYYELAAAKFQTYNNNNASELNSMAWDFYENVSDKAQLNSASEMAKRACELSSTYANLDTYAALSYKTNNYRLAKELALKAIDLAKADNMSEDDYKETTLLLKKITEAKNNNSKK